MNKPSSPISPLSISHTVLAPVVCEYAEEHTDFGRVTKILSIRHKEELEKWRLSLGELEAARVSTIATDLGTMVHDAIEQFLSGISVAQVLSSLPQDYTVMLYGKEVVKSPRKLFRGFLHWYQKYQPTEVYIEQRLCDHQLGYIGRCDLIAKVDGKWGVYDFKTSKKFNIDMGFQLSAYAWAIEMLLGIKVEERCIIRLLDSTFKGYQLKSYQDELPIFLAHLDIYNRVEEERKPMEDPNANWDGGIILGPNVATNQTDTEATQVESQNTADSIHAAHQHMYELRETLPY